MAWALAWQDEERLRCDGCGLPKDVTMAPGADRQHWQVHTAGCAACEARENHVAAMSQAGNAPRGMYFWVTEP